MFKIATLRYKIIAIELYHNYLSNFDITKLFLSLCKAPKSSQSTPLHVHHQCVSHWNVTHSFFYIRMSY